MIDHLFCGEKRAVGGWAIAKTTLERTLLLVRIRPCFGAWLDTFSHSQNIKNVIHQNTIEAVLAQMRIEEVVSDFVELKKSGSNLSACCPFHSERKPSFFVTPSRDIFKCFGCGEAGNAITFLQKKNGWTFPAAIEYLAKKYSVEIKFTTQKADPDFDEKTKIRATLDAAQADFASSENADFLKYWESRGILSETLDTFGIGFCSWGQSKIFEKSALIEAGLAGEEKGTCSFIGRTTIAFHDQSGRIAGFAARTIKPDEDPKFKYLYGRTTPVFQKSKILFNLHRAAPYIRKEGEVWIVEGPIDAIALWQAGIKNVVAIGGLHLSDDQLNQLRPFNGDKNLRIFLSLDNEKETKTTVAQAFEATLQKLLPLGEVRSPNYPKNKNVKDMADWVSVGNFDRQAVTHHDALGRFVEDLFEKDRIKNRSAFEIADDQERAAKMIAKVKRENVMDRYITEHSGIMQLSAKKLSDLARQHRDGSKSDNRKSEELLRQKHIKVGDEYLELQPREDILTGNITMRYVRRKKDELKDEKGPSYTKQIPKFTAFHTRPNHLKYERVIEIKSPDGEPFRFFNQYEPLPFVPKDFDFPESFNFSAPLDYKNLPEIANTARFLEHIFGAEQYGTQYLELGWDWITLLFNRPTQRLPAIALVSSDEGTGKSTFIQLLLMLFGENATKTDASRIGAKFNSMSANKCLVCIEETKDEKGGIENILKDLITSFEKVVEKKFSEAEVVPSFEKYVFASNHESDFMKVGTETTRFFVMKVNRLKGEIDPDFHEKMAVELPYLMTFLERRPVATRKTDRLWFSPKLFENEALLKLRQASKDVVHQAMESLLQQVWTRTETDLPVLRFRAEHLRDMMIFYGGRIYENKTPNYFGKVALEQLKAHQKETPTSFTRLFLKGGDWPTKSIWEHEKINDKGRCYEFSIWKMLSPDDFEGSYTADNREALLKNMATSNLRIDETERARADVWIASVQKIVKFKAEYGQLELVDAEGEDLPF